MILINKTTKVIVQGITGHQGTFQTRLMKEFGTNIAAGVTPGKGGQDVDGIPVYNTVGEALKNHKAEWSAIFVPAKHAKDAAFEALDNGLNLVIITENIPVLDAVDIMAKAKQEKKIILGPNCPGITSVGECKIGIMPNNIFLKGNVGVVSRSGTLTYEVIHNLTKNNIGQSTCVGIGGDQVIGLGFIEVLEMFEKDKDTEKIVLVGEIGGDSEERAADHIKQNITKPVVAYIAGKTAPKGKRMGHAGAIIMRKSGTAETKIKALEKAGIKVAELVSEIGKLIS